MSRAWIAFYMGDYQKDTNRLTTLEHGAYFLLLQECWTHGKIPLDDEDRAAIAKMPLKDWLKIAPKMNVYFEEDGTQKRASKEIEKADVTRLKRATSGKVGGIKSGISRAITKGEVIKNEAKLQAKVEQTEKQKPKPHEATLNREDSFSFTSSSFGTAREEQNGTSPSGGSRSAPVGSAVASEPPISENEENPLLASLKRLEANRKAAAK